jgi:hypothetical protein
MFPEIVLRRIVVARTELTRMPPPSSGDWLALMVLSVNSNEPVL